MTDTAPTRIWTRDFSLAVVTNTFISLVFYMLMSAMTLYAATQFGAHDTVAGLTSSMFIIGSLAARVYAGKLLDVVGRRRMLLGSLVVFVLASLSYWPIENLGLLLAVRFVHGMAFGAGNTAVAAAVQGLIPPRRRGEGTGYFGLSTTVAMAVGPLLAVAWSSTGNWSAIFVFCAVASAIGFAVAWVLRLPERPASAEERASWWRLRPSDVLDPGALPVAIVMLLTGVAYSSILTFLASYAVSKDMAAAASAFFLVYAATVLVSRLVVGRVQDRFGDNAVMYPTLSFFVLALLVVGWAPNGFALASAGVLGGLGFGAMMTSAQAIVVSRAAPARVGVVTSTFYFMLDLGSGFGPVVLGVVVGAFGFSDMYFMLAGLVVLTIGWYWFAHGRRAVSVRAPAVPAGRGRVLVGVDGSADALRAVRYARHAALASDLDVWVVSAVGTAVTGSDVGAQQGPDDLTRTAASALAEAREYLAQVGFPADRVVAELAAGHAVHALTELSARAELLVVGRRSVSGLERMFLGSTSLGVVSGAQCPVVVISHASTPHDTGDLGVITVAVGSRDTQGDAHALEHGFAEAVRRDAAVRVAHVVRPGDDESASREEMLVLVDALQRRHPDLEVLVDLPVEDPAPSVDALVALTEQSDLLVVTTRGYRVAGLPLGGAVRGLLAHAHCPVALV